MEVSFRTLLFLGKMRNEFDLSGEIEYGRYAGEHHKFKMKDVKEFINRLKNDIVENDIYTADEIFRIINKLAGDKLI